jgi:AcrR family transcriptional regulator
MSAYARPARFARDYDQFMPDDPQERAETGRQRAAETKRTRSHERLIAAATDLFGAHGWYGTRVEDVAARAGVSVATTYNHFPNKYHLLAEAYAPLLNPVIAGVQADLATTMPTSEALQRSVHALCRTTRQYRAMTVAVISALPEIYARQGLPTAPDDPRFRVELERPVIEVVEAGRDRGEMVPRLPPSEIGLITSGILVLRVLNRPDEDPDTTAGVLLTVLQGGLIG